jgi:hypothetical protein
VLLGILAALSMAVLAAVLGMILDDVKSWRN